MTQQHFIFSKSREVRVTQFWLVTAVTAAVIGLKMIRFEFSRKNQDRICIIYLLRKTYSPCETQYGLENGNILIIYFGCLNTLLSRWLERVHWHKAVGQMVKFCMITKMFFISRKKSNPNRYCYDQ